MQKAFSFIFLIFLFLGSCKDSKNSFEEGYENAQNDARVEEQLETENALELFVFDGGRIFEHGNQHSRKQETQENELRILADAFYVVKHSKGVLIWDTGLPEKVVGEDPFTTSDGAFTISRKDSLVKQLASIGLSTEDVDYIGFSNIYFDHTGAANYFPNAKWLVQENTLDFIKSDSVKDNNLYDLASFDKLTDKKMLNGDYDLFDDGKVIVKYVSGPADGNQGLFVNLEQHGPVLLARDKYHFMEHKGRMVNSDLIESWAESNKNLDIVDEFVRVKNPKIYIQHDINDFKSLQKAPKSLK
ncbi:MBL fold metallo-hydrolase [Flavimarina sp. Hel_I_48]|uniref:MBL fold metallo-hydrolase n=1 Tax=Flavimarina sp. Hel_I_48 TaxID=1392488 RepID=UPI00068FB971|nr:MBL fold metallo-hydrolase [Flavimarina sp. Hel_I_48]